MRDSRITFDFPAARSDTALVLPSGLIHLRGAFIAGRTSAEAAAGLVWERAQDGARRLGGPLLLMLGLPDGSVDHRLVIPGEPPLPVERTNHAPSPDVRWAEEIPDRSGLLTCVLSAQEAGNAEDAESAAARLAAGLRQDLGVHPYAVLALELQARCAEEAGKWALASMLHLTAAVARHQLGAPGPGEAESLQQAVIAWHRSPDGALSINASTHLAHHLIGLCPTAPAVLAGVLRALDSQLPASPPRRDAALPAREDR